MAEQSVLFAKKDSDEKLKNFGTKKRKSFSFESTVSNKENENTINKAISFTVQRDEKKLSNKTFKHALSFHSSDSSFLFNNNQQTFLPQTNLKEKPINLNNFLTNSSNTFQVNQNEAKVNEEKQKMKTILEEENNNTNSSFLDFSHVMKSNPEHFSLENDYEPFMKNFGDYSEKNSTVSPFLSNNSQNLISFSDLMAMKRRVLQVEDISPQKLGLEEQEFKNFVFGYYDTLNERNVK